MWVNRIQYEGVTAASKISANDSTSVNMYKPEITKKSADLARSNRLKFHADEEKHDIVAVIYAREVVKQALN